MSCTSSTARSDLAALGRGRTPMRELARHSAARSTTPSLTVPKTVIRWEQRHSEARLTLPTEIRSHDHHEQNTVVAPQRGHRSVCSPSVLYPILPSDQLHPPPPTSPKLPPSSCYSISLQSPTTVLHTLSPPRPFPALRTIPIRPSTPKTSGSHAASAPPRPSSAQAAETNDDSLTTASKPANG